ncbi:MAG: tetratricopeptide repeat protein [Pseudomonadota bacterium]|nr:tetratricopeptide repeat protein [Pseudomonadota bacterium]
MTSQADSKTYTIRALQEMLGLSRGVITGLIASGFVAPSRGPRNEYRVTFREVVLLRTAVELQAARIPPRRILASLRKLKATLPAELPLTGLRITAVGNDVTVRDGRSQWHADTGQLVMDFELAPVRGTVAFLQRVPGPATLPATAALPPRVRAEAAPQDDDVAAVFGLGEALEASDPRAAEAAYRRVLSIDPGHADAYLNLGALLCESRRCAEAVALYDEALRRRPDEALLHFNRAIALEDQGRTDEALASYHASLQLAPDLADAHYNAARLHEQLGDAKKAVRHFSAYRRLQQTR